ncbi:MAG: DEAD/DEAH box helicase, partial [Armatimonadota bacterium]
MDPQSVLRERFGFDAFRPGQEAVVRALLDGRSALAVFPTGGGKSLCCWLPAVLLDGLVVVVSPLVALMKDQVDGLLRRGISAARWDGSLDAEAVRDLVRRIDEGTLSLLYVAPERFHNERFLARLSRSKVAMLAIDEAH